MSIQEVGLLELVSCSLVSIKIINMQKSSKNFHKNWKMIWKMILNNLRNSSLENISATAVC